MTLNGAVPVSDAGAATSSTRAVRAAGRTTSQLPPAIGSEPVSNNTKPATRPMRRLVSSAEEIPPAAARRGHDGWAATVLVGVVKETLSPAQADQHRGCRSREVASGSQAECPDQHGCGAVGRWGRRFDRLVRLFRGGSRDPRVGSWFAVRRQSEHPGRHGFAVASCEPVAHAQVMVRAYETGLVSSGARRRPEPAEARTTRSGTLGMLRRHGFEPRLEYIRNAPGHRH
jgi:hypothetical protein